ncbi:MAG: hypothetical protein JWN81_1080 [Solirubrobacterales bacterium]|jgi:hypothetical protein|nr:hypothetical protein [Solirubrobacterales bacterium]
MRPHLLHPLADRRHARRGRTRGAQEPLARAADTAAQRVRDAGGPIDRASYSCECGLLFQARVSTTVMCPHCGAGQAW